MNQFTLTEINVYPIKSLGGVQRRRVELTERGLALDRRWMLVDRQGRFLTQREHPVMALLDVSVDEQQLIVSHRKTSDESLVVPIMVSGPEVDVLVWQNICKAIEYPANINRQFSDWLNVDCRLVFMPDDSRRPVDPEYSAGGHVVSFADGFPCLIIGEASLADLNERLDQPVPMDRFRTNLVFSGGPPFAEDSWSRITIGQTEFRVVKPCARCVMTTVDQQTGDKGAEPLRTLSRYRRVQNRGVMFGQNLLHDEQGTLEIGMPITPL